MRLGARYALAKRLRRRYAATQAKLEKKPGAYSIRLVSVLNPSF
jgi:hypothetical protein